MENVAKRLEQIASEEKCPKAANVFGRSAFNRYYYAAFLETRAALRNLNPDWGKPAHASVPELLVGQVLMKLKKQISMCEKQGLIARGRASDLRKQANTVTSTLADLLKAAREVRRVADYEPEVPCTLDAKGISLGTSTLHAARQWPQRVRNGTSMVQSMYNELGLV